MIDQRLARRRHPALRQRDAVEQADDPLRDRAQVVLDLGAEGDHAERLASALVRSVIIALEHQLAAARHQHGMEVGQAAILRPNSWRLQMEWAERRPRAD
jgi:hypothetical protein